MELFLGIHQSLLCLSVQMRILVVWPGYVSWCFVTSSCNIAFCIASCTIVLT